MTDVEDVRNRVEATDAVAEEASDRTELAVVDEDLKALPGLGAATEHDAGVGRPVGVHLELQLEVAEGGVGNEVSAPARMVRILPADDGAVLDGPHRWIPRGAFVVVRRHPVG